MSDLRFKTTESGQVIRRQLYLNDRDNPTFECHIIVPVVLPDSVADIEKSLYVARKYDVPHDYRLANGDSVYNTTASLTPDGEKFAIDIIIRHADSNVAPATISMSEAGMEAAKHFMTDTNNS